MLIIIRKTRRILTAQGGMTMILQALKEAITAAFLWFGMLGACYAVSIWLFKKRG